MNINHETAPEWFAQRGITAYVTKINDAKTYINEIKGDAGRYWQECEFTMKSIKNAEDEIKELQEAAYDRYMDYVTDGR